MIGGYFGGASSLLTKSREKDARAGRRRVSGLSCAEEELRDVTLNSREGIVKTEIAC